MNGLYDEFRVALHSIWTRRWLALAIAWGLCLLGWLVVSQIPNGYESRARVFVQVQSILPTKIGITATEQQKEIDRVRQTLTSAINLEKVVRGTDIGLTVASPRDVTDRIESLRKVIKITAQQDNLFEITATAANGGMSDAANAKLARAIVQKLIDIFVEENLAGDRDETRQTLQFLDQQLNTRQKQLQEAEARRAEFETKYMGLLPGAGSISQRVEAARNELASVDSNLASAQSSLASVNGQMAGTAAGTNTPGSGAVAGPARARLSAIEGQLADARGKGWTDSHPDVIALRSQLGAARAAAAGERSGGGGGYSAPNPLYVTLRSMQAEKQATVAALSSRKAQLQADMAQLMAKQTEEPGVAAEQARINRDYTVLKDQYDKLRADREDVALRGQVRTETDAIKFRVIDPPTSPRTPTAPNRPLLLSFVLAVGLGGGIGAAFGLGQLQTTFATAGRLEKASGMPVIGSVSEVLTAAQSGLRARNFKLFLGGAGALAVAYTALIGVEMIQRGMVA